MVEVANTFVERNDSQHPTFGIFGEKDGVPKQGQRLKHILSIRIFDIFLERGISLPLFVILYLCEAYFKRKFFFGNKRACISHKKALKMLKILLLKLMNLTIKVSKHFQMLIILKSSFFVWCTAILSHFLLKLAML